MDALQALLGKITLKRVNRYVASDRLSMIREMHLLNSFFPQARSANG